MFETHSSAQVRMNALLYNVFALMGCALVSTGIVAYLVATVPALMALVWGNSWIASLLLIGQLALVMSISFLINRINVTTAVALFFSYAITLGITLSSIFLVYVHSSIYQAFFVAASMFGVMSLYGYFTNSDLSRIGSFLMMGLWGIIISGLINLYFQSTVFDLLLSVLGVLIFMLLTAYDIQKIKRMGHYMVSDQEGMAKAAVVCALMLYLDFVNLFLYILRFMGKRRN
jgi:FtsH-binding integral membrane protein